MAQSGYTPISIYYSSTATNVPTAGNLVNGELAINITDGKLYYKDNAGVVKLLASNGASTPVTSFQTSLGGLTPSTATTGVVTLAGTLNTSSGGTGLTTYTAGDLPYYASGTALSKLAIGTTGQILTSTGTGLQWTSLSSVGVTTISFGSTGLTPATATSGAVTVAGTLAIANGGTGLTSLTAGYIPYGNGTSAFSNSANLYFSGSKFGVNTATPAVTAVFVGTDALQIPVGSAAQQPGQSGQPTPAAGMLRFNNGTTQFEGYNGTVWASVGGAAISNDTTTATNEYPLFASATSGTALTIYTSNAKYLYKPSTGDLQSSQVVAGNGFFVNPTTLVNSYTLPASFNASTTGPFTIPSGLSVTVSSGSRWVVL